MKAANKENFDEELQFVTEFYGDDMNIDQLRYNVPKSNGRHTLHCVVIILRDLTPIQRVLVAQVCTLVFHLLILVLPAINATSERSFSTRVRCGKLKPFYEVRTMTIVRLNNAMYMPKSINLIDFGNDFFFRFMA